ncbi:MAG: hypothetical protein FWC39_02875 [Bacteroidetes bacterium]|nr:hypothetical protein [Bacteroidota bacterium]
MNWKCLFVHKWNGCKCEKCGKIRDYEDEHQYVPVEGKCVEKCSICGKEQTISHAWNGCKCVQCGAVRDIHAWNGCKCVQCGAVRDILHKWNGGCKCELCGITRDEGVHKWLYLENECVENCSICGKQRIRHKWTFLENKCIEECSICGKQRIRHKWVKLENECIDRCSTCGEERSIGHIWKYRIQYEEIYGEWGTSANKYYHIKYCTVCGKSEEEKHELSNKNKCIDKCICGFNIEEHNWQHNVRVRNGPGYMMGKRCTCCGKEVIYGM